MKSLFLINSLLCLIIIFAGGCASISMLPENADAVSFGEAEGKTGWSQYAQEESFSNYSKEQIYEASKAALGMAGFSLRKANIEEGYVIGEHGMTAHDWNIIAGIYFKKIEHKIKLKVIIVCLLCSNLQQAYCSLCSDLKCPSTTFLCRSTM